MRPTNSSAGRPSTPSERLAAARSPGEKSDASTPCGIDLDAFGIGAVVADELGALVGGGRDHEVGAAHDLGLDARPERDLVVEADLGPHAVERVERGDERQVELVLQPVSDRAGHPVVRVQHVVVGAATLERGARRIAEGRDQLGELTTGHRCAWAGVDVQDAKARLDDDERRLLGVLGACEHVDQHTRPRQGRGERTDVDVHAAGIAATRLRERRRVHTQHGNPHSPTILPVHEREAALRPGGPEVVEAPPQQPEAVSVG